MSQQNIDRVALDVAELIERYGDHDFSGSLRLALIEEHGAKAWSRFGLVRLAALAMLQASRIKVDQ